MIKAYHLCGHKKLKMTKVTIAKGDGIGPEIMDATLEIILAAGAKIETEEIQVGEEAREAGLTMHVPD